MKLAKSYFWVPYGEIVRKTDQFFSQSLQKWVPANLADVGRYCTTTYFYRRRNR